MFLKSVIGCIRGFSEFRALNIQWCVGESREKHFTLKMEAVRTFETLVS